MNQIPQSPDFLRDYHVILASRSPRRRELLSFITSDFEIMVSHFDETPLMREHTLSPSKLVEALSTGKAEAVLALSDLPDRALVVGGDTVVVSPDGEIFGIPTDREDAERMIRALSGRPHQVITGMTIATHEKKVSFSVATEVEFYSLDDDQIDWYLNTGEPFDKAGAYGIQGYGSLLVKRISGNYDNVVGLPTAELFRRMQKFCQKSFVTPK